MSVDKILKQPYFVFEILKTFGYQKLDWHLRAGLNEWMNEWVNESLFLFSMVTIISDSLRIHVLSIRLSFIRTWSIFMINLRNI